MRMPKSRVSIHAPVQGATGLRAGILQESMSFNPRPRAGGDQFQNFSVEGIIAVSIHAPVQGATHEKRPEVDLFIVSIHAPVQGATVGDPVAKSCLAFQSTPPCRGRLPNVKIISHPFLVSIHAPVQGATGANRPSPRPQRFQSTPPCRGRLFILQGKHCPQGFNPRPRAGGDSISKLTVQRLRGFNPRPRAGGDLPSCGSPRPSTGFNPRPRAGGDQCSNAGAI